MKKAVVVGFAWLAAAVWSGASPAGVPLRAQQATAPSTELSPRGAATTQVGGRWESSGAAGDVVYTGGKWILIDYGRPALRGRTHMVDKLSGQGNPLVAGERIWRLGANETTRLRTEVSLVFGETVVPAGEYSLFVALRHGLWTLILSRQPYQIRYDPANKTETWGARNYDPKFDIARARMTVTTGALSIEQLTLGFANMTAHGGSIVVWWETTVASVSFRIRP